jgi:hypothetical protein
MFYIIAWYGLVSYCIFLSSPKRSYIYFWYIPVLQYTTGNLNLTPQRSTICLYVYLLRQATVF